MADVALEALDDMPWEQVESALGHDPAVELRRALRGLAGRGAAATEEDCDPLFQRQRTHLEPLLDAHAEQLGRAIDKARSSAGDDKPACVTTIVLRLNTSC
ncbi:hypothetical protein BM536_008225 [Streptomyces phaeoluteigriseus]|uniref:Uncharacterized protein n=1 Tax=Streptomyces phaeoluteigriseus TaxID=114686 RepID=A0A1V6MUY8_9ACTN|nr:hypothetical protein [Streptomyces phaeoluteigriseus]OQD56268.1 hypothetical protein BM536_008225 [Streptomyces phaeoluteigriseus]